jgi:hypothetical protein
MRSLKVVLVASVCVVLACSAGSKTGDRSTSQANATRSLSRQNLVDALRNAGLTLHDAGTVEQPFYSVPAHVYQIDGRDLQVYEFSSSAEAEQAAAQVAPDGGSIGTNSMAWMAPPHFFRKDRVVVNYIGTSSETLAALERVLGPQFAGRS